jgi:GNAT superfamily N-acetyltransferase
MNQQLHIREARSKEAAVILAMQKRAFLVEAVRYNDMTIPPLQQTLEQMHGDIESMSVLVGLIEGVVVGSVRGRVLQGVCHIGRLMVHSHYHKRGIGGLLLDAIEQRLGNVDHFELQTGCRSPKNLAFYGNRGYRVVSQEGILVTMRKASISHNKLTQSE